MKFTGDENLVEISKFLEGHGERVAAIVAAAYFDERLGKLTGENKDFFGRINRAYDVGLVTANEKDDLHAIRKIRNRCAHDFRADGFDDDDQQAIDGLHTWKIYADSLRMHDELKLPLERLLYVTCALVARLSRRTVPPTPQVLAEPKPTDVDAFPPVVSTSSE
ncbi:MAG: hypothetical protein MPJ50_05335 [Pirellulales bacterium]|nr:hypothetical protein [Pirellulales bacterium]